MPIDLSDITVDPKRYTEGEELDTTKTGIFVRAKILTAISLEGDKKVVVRDLKGDAPLPRWSTVDIYYLDRPSLMKWLRSRGGENEWAEHCVALLLGHPPEQ